MEEFEGSFVELRIGEIRAQLDYSPHEKWHVVVEFLVGDMKGLKHTDWGDLLEKVTNTLCDDLVSDFVVLTKNHQGILTLLL